jgi:transposase-like protein
MIETWRNRPTEGEHPYVYLDGHRGGTAKGCPSDREDARLRLANAAELVATAVEETLAYYDFPEEHWRRIQFNNPLNAFCVRSAENPRRRLVPGWAIGAQSRRG